ncbi:haloacid dehalogenase-like hydrolase [Niveibacterium sp. SC-1]|uniref:HAD family hydrolase n=1 Tax=Niveibacterium sp. SC-1 TaxID=3135646 RepID=UPI00311D3020
MDASRPRLDPHWRIASFDLDGTLIVGTSSGRHLAERLGHVDAMALLEARYGRGEASNREVAEFDAWHFRGLEMRDVEAMLADIPLIAGIGETVGRLRGAGIVPVINTLARDGVAEVIAKRFGFLAWSGPRLARDELGRFTGEVALHFEAEDKCGFLQALCARHAVAPASVVHVGDSRSDLAAFRFAGLGIAFNGDAQACAVAHRSLRGDTLVDVLSEFVPQRVGPFSRDPA